MNRCPERRAVPSRRSLLAAASLAAGTPLAGCSTVTGPSGIAATFRNDLFDPPDAETAPIVARAGARSGEHGCPEGLARTEARVHEVRRSDDRTELVLVTEHDVITGESGCSSGWGQTGIAVRHDWRSLSEDGAVTDGQSDVVPAGDDDGKQATLERQHSSETGDWRVHLTPPTKSTRTYHFASTFARPGSLDDGDVLAETRTETRVRKGWFGGNDTLETGTTLTYGESER